MKPVDQTLFKERGEPGDCYRACIASIMENAIDTVPHFTLDAFREAGADVSFPPFNYDALNPFNAAVNEIEPLMVNRWLSAFGKRLYVPTSWDGLENRTERYAIGSGQSPRAYHAVVVDLWSLRRVGDRIEFTIAHDPHPTRSGVQTVDFVEIIEDVAA